jgi:dTDP-glucose 4,6-dehydratase
VRIFNTYGPRMRLHDGRVVPAFISQALKNKPLTVFGRGTQTRSFCYCSDLIEGIYRLMMSGERAGQHWQSAGNDDAGICARDHQGHRVAQQNCFPPLPQDDPQQRQPDIGRAKALFGVGTAGPLAEGIVKTIEYFRGRFLSGNGVWVRQFHALCVKMLLKMGASALAKGD